MVRRLGLGKNNHLTQPSISAVVVSLRSVSCGPWASCLMFVLFFPKNLGLSFHVKVHVRYQAFLQIKTRKISICHLPILLIAISCKLSLEETICMKFHSVFSLKNKKRYFKMSSV